MNTLTILATADEETIVNSKIVPRTTNEVQLVHERQFYLVLDTWLFAGYAIVHETLKFQEKDRLFAYTFSSYASSPAAPNIPHLRAFLNTNLPICRVPCPQIWRSFRLQILELAIENKRGMKWARLNDFSLPETYHPSLNSDKFRTHYMIKSKFTQLIPLNDKRESAVLALRYNVYSLLLTVKFPDVIFAYYTERNTTLVKQYLSQMFMLTHFVINEILRNEDMGQIFFFDFYSELVIEPIKWFELITRNRLYVSWTMLDKIAHSIDWEANPYSDPAIDSAVYERYKAPQAYGRFGNNLTEEILIDHLLRGFPLSTRFAFWKYQELLQTENVRRVISYLGLSKEQFTWSIKNLQLLGSKFNAVMTTLCLLRQSEETVWSLISNELLFTILHFVV